MSLLQVFKEARGTKPAASPRASPTQGPGAAQPSHRLPCSWFRGTAQLEALPGALPLFLQPPLHLYSQGSPLSSGLCFVLPQPFASPKGHLCGQDCSWHLCKVSLRQQGSSRAAKAFWFMSYRRRLSGGANRPERRTSCQARCTLPRAGSAGTIPAGQVSQSRTIPRIIRSGATFPRWEFSPNCRS